jgi:hypothetical protein
MLNSPQRKSHDKQKWTREKDEDVFDVHVHYHSAIFQHRRIRTYPLSPCCLPAHDTWTMGNCTACKAVSQELNEIKDSNDTELEKLKKRLQFVRLCIDCLFTLCIDECHRSHPS